ncbi:MAG: hypothetical protein D3923_05345 [Candidatus Electrothrix sp. AR3]|nr:hypothetical protein [Candidatus Electrothrix sp. AR3]
MARKKQTRGNCVYCDRSMTRTGMSKHLQTCEKRIQTIEAATAQSGKQTILYHVLIQDMWGGDFWLHVEISEQVTLKKLDVYLRAIWLECCGHLSQFSFDQRGEELSMGQKIGKIFKPGLELIHIYDFGTSSETKIKVISSREGKATTSHPIALMSRNDIPEVECAECDQLATYLCLECFYEGVDGTLCDKHTKNHSCEEYGSPVKLVNSPRVGMCGYTGPADPPY